MDEKIARIKNFVNDNKEDMVNGLILVGAIVLSFNVGRISTKEHVEIGGTYTDKEGNVVREIYKKIVK